MDASSKNMGSIKYRIKLTRSGSTVTVRLKPIKGTDSTPGCPILSADIVGAILESLSGGLMLPIAESPASDSPTIKEPEDTLSSEEPVPGLTTVPAPLNLKVVSRSTENLTVLWDFALNVPHSYSAYLDGVKVAEKITRTSYTFTGLELDHDYQLEILTVTENGESSPSRISGSTTSSGSSGSGSFGSGGGCCPNPDPTSEAEPTEEESSGPLIFLEFKVNTYTTGAQFRPVVAMDEDGNFVVVWHSNDNRDGDGTGVFAQRYDSSGNPQGSEFRVNTYTVDRQQHPSVAMDSDGDFVIAWQSEGGGYGPDNYESIQVQRYDSSGNPQGSEFQINTHTTDTQQKPRVAIDSDGDFVVVWQSFDGCCDIFARRYDSSGNAKDGSEFKVNTLGESGQDDFSVAMDSDGNFVITWIGANAQDGSENGIFARRYNSLGVAQDSEFQVNTYTTGSQIASVIAMDNDGNFVIAWMSEEHDGDTYRSIQAQRYNALGVTQGTEFQVNTYTTVKQEFPAIAMDSDGDFIITWTSGYYSYESGQDGDDGGIFAQRYHADGSLDGSEFRINTYTTGGQLEVSVAMDSDGDFIMTWESKPGQDGSSFGIFAGNGS